MKYNSLVYLSILVGTAIAARFKRRAGEWTIKAMSCYTNPKYATNQLCRLTPVNRHYLNMSFGLTLLAAQTNLTLALVQWQKMNSNRYMPGFFNVKADACDLTANLYNNRPNVLKTVLSKIDPKFKEKFKSIVHPCPYGGQTYIHNVSMAKVEQSPMLNLLPMADFKIDHTFFSSTNEVIFSLTMFTSTK